jgi:hypothetical protein
MWKTRLTQMEYPDSRSPLQQLVVAVRVSGNKNGPPVASEMKVHLELRKYYEHKNTGATLQQDTSANNNNNNNNNNNKSKIKQLGTTALLIIIIPCK